MTELRGLLDFMQTLEEDMVKFDKVLTEKISLIAETDIFSKVLQEQYFTGKKSAKQVVEAGLETP